MRILQTQTDVDAENDSTSNSTTDGDRNGATLHQGGPRHGHDGDFVNGTYIDNDGDNGVMGGQHGDGRFPVALVAGIGGGVLFLLIVLIIVLCCCYCKKKKSQEKATSTNKNNDNGEHIAVGSAQSIEDYPVLDENYHGKGNNQQYL